MGWLSPKLAYGVEYWKMYRAELTAQSKTAAKKKEE